jgi:hypothetical protein
LTIALVVSGTPTVAQFDPQAIQRMVATERAFAAATAEVGVRDGFLSFFADDAIEIVPPSDRLAAAVRPAKARLEALDPPKLPLLTKLMWEPFTGQVSVDGTLGWLTGGYVGLNEPTGSLTARGAYFSVWKRQTNGTWRVWLDEGITLPGLWEGASPFRAAPDPDMGTAGGSDESLAIAEAAVSTTREAWLARLASDVRLHRDGVMPIVGRDRVAGWAAGAWQRTRYVTIRTEIAGSNDLGVALGGYEATIKTPAPATTSAGAAEIGTWVRVWKRDLGGRWRIIFETTKPAR